MKKQRIYLDTSVFGGLFDEEFKDFTEPLFDRIKKSEFGIIHSDITEQELENAPERIRATTKLLPSEKLDRTRYIGHRNCKSGQEIHRRRRSWSNILCGLPTYSLGHKAQRQYIDQLEFQTYRECRENSRV